MKRVFLVRHGNAYNDKWHQDKNSVLNASGLKHAEALAKRFKDFKVTQIYSSTIERAKETSSAFSKYHPHIDVVYSDMLREVFDFGQPTTRKVENLVAPKFEETKKEVFDKFKYFVKDSSDGNIFLFTHGNFIRLVLLNILDGSMEGFFKLSMEFSSVSCIEIEDDGTFKLLFYNDATHTKDLPFGCSWLINVK